MGILDIFGLGGGGNGAPTGTPGATPTASPVGGFLSKLGLDDPDKRSRLGQSLIALGGSMMKAGGPSYTPNNFLGALGDGMQSFAKTYAGGQDDALKRAYLQAQIGNMGANTKLHTIQAAAAEAQAKARAEFNGTPNAAGAGTGPIIAPPGGAPVAPGAPSPVPVAPGTVAGPGPAPVAPGAPAPVQAPGAPMDIRPPVARTAGAPGPVIGPQGPVPASAAPRAPAPGPVPAPASTAAPVPTQEDNAVMARIGQLNREAQRARGAGYEDVARQYTEQALALEKHLSSNGMFLRPDGTAGTVPGYAAGKGQTAQAESAAKAQGQLPTDLLKMQKESELRREEQAAKDQSGDKKTAEDRTKELNATWNANEYNKKFLNASNIRAGFDRAYADKSGLGTAQLVLDWYKLNDPGSVVSQNEMQTLSTKTQSLSEGLVASVNQALGGGGMSEENKAKLLKNMDGKYQDQRKTYEKQRDNQRTLAGKLGTDPTLAIPDLAELHSPWKTPQEIAAEQAAAAAAGRNPALGGGGSTSAPRPPEALGGGGGGGGGSTFMPRPPEALGGGGGGGAPAGLPTLGPNDPRLKDLKPGDRFIGTNGVTYQK